jgi:hypothetical protein
MSSKLTLWKIALADTRLVPLAWAAALAMAVAPGGAYHATAQNTLQEGGGMVISSQSGNSGRVVPPPRDPEAVIAEEFRLALDKGTREALIRFIARHPDHELSGQALVLLRSGKGLKEAGIDPADPDAAIYAAFDRAIRRDDVIEYESFIARHPDHPLAVIARRLRDRLPHPRRDRPRRREEQGSTRNAGPRSGQVASPAGDRLSRSM